MQISFNKKLDMYIQPSYTHSVLGYKILGEPLEIKPYRVGIGIGLLYHF
jgi:hypothetical protein